MKSASEHTSAPLESNRKTMKSASGKRPPDKAHTAPHSKNRLNFVKHFRNFFQNIFAILQMYYQNVAIACNYGPKFTNLIFRNFSNLYGKDQHLLDSSQFSWDFATNIFENSENDFRKVRKKLETI